MNYVQAILSGLAAIFVAYVAILWPEFRNMSGQRFTGLGVFVEGISSLILWILAVLFFALFFAASRIRNELLKTFLFWIPTLLFSTLTVAILALVTYVFVRFKHS